MLRRPTYDWPAPPIRETRGRMAAWLSWAAAASGAAWLVWFVLDHDTAAAGLSERSWATLGLAAVLGLVLLARHAQGAWALGRALAEYATVALLAGLLLAATAPPPAKPHRPSGRPSSSTTRPATTRQPAPPPASAVQAKLGRAGDGCPPIRQPVEWVGCMWRQANPPTTTTDKGKAP